MKGTKHIFINLYSYQSKISHEENKDKKATTYRCLNALSWMQSHARYIKKILKPTLKIIMTKDFFIDLS